MPANPSQPATIPAAPTTELLRYLRRTGNFILHWLDTHTFLGGMCVFAATFLSLTTYVGLLDRMMPTSDGWAIYWPFNGIALAFLLLAHRRHWPWILAAFVSAAIWHEAGGEPIADVAIDVVSDFIEVVIAAYALPHFHNLRQWMMEPRLVMRFTVAGIFLGPLVSGLPVAWYFSQTRHGSFWHHIEKWAFADALGTVLWTPLILVLFSRETYDLFRLRALPTTLRLLGTLYAVTWFTFLQGSYPLSFLPYPFLLFVALRLGFSGAVIGANMLALISAYLSLQGHGPFVVASHSWDDTQTTLLRIFSTLAMLFVFPLCVMLMERRNFEERLQQAYIDMKQLASVDGLTGIANRRRFDEALEAEWHRALHNQTPLSLLMIDADHFKAYNDRYGHVAGDECLRRIATVLARSTYRPHDLVARYGGEEFAILLPEVPGNLAEGVAHRMRTNVATEDVIHEGNPLGYVTVSVGFSSIVPASGLSPRQLVSAADGALYLAKKNGRNRVYSADPF